MALPLAGAWAARALEPAASQARVLAAGVALCGVPVLQAYGAWFLADVPTCVVLLCAWGAVARFGAGGRGSVAVLGVTVALLTRVSAAPLLLGPVALAVLTRLRAPPWLRPVLVLALGCVAIAIHPPRVAALNDLPAGLAALVIQARPAWALAAVIGARRSPLRGWLGAVLWLGLPAVLLYSPVVHAARYALPLGHGHRFGHSAEPMTTALLFVGEDASPTPPRTPRLPLRAA